MESLLLRPDDAARVLSLSRARLYELMAAGVIKSIKIGGSRRIPAEALKRFVDDQVAAQSADQAKPTSDNR